MLRNIGIALFAVTCAIILIYTVSFGISRIVLSDAGSTFLSEYKKAEEERKQEAWDNATPQQKQEAIDTIDGAFKKWEELEITKIEKDGTKQVLDLPAFWNSNVNDIKFVCIISLPDDFYKTIENYKRQILQGETELNAILERRPDCFENGSRDNFKYHDPTCSDIKPAFLLAQDLSFKSIDGRNYTEQFCERLDFYRTKN